VSTGRRYWPAIKGVEFATSVADGNALEHAVPEMQSARQVAVIGGGPSGVELASALSEEYPACKVHLIISGDRLLPAAPPKATREAEQYFATRPNVVLHYRQRATAISPSRQVTLRDGTVLNSSVAFACTGGKPNTEFLQGALPLDHSGSVKVSPDLRVEGLANVFAIGDVNNIAEEKLVNVCLGGGCVLRILTLSFSSGSESPGDGGLREHPPAGC
jgi:NADH dehydrogenase FAD-containing subunit